MPVEVVAFGHGRHVALDLDARRLGGDDEHRHPLVRRGIRVSDRHDNEERGVAGVGREPFLAVDDPFAAVSPGTAGELLRVGARMRFCHGERGDDGAVKQRLQVPAPLLRRAEQREDLRVAGVRRGRSEHSRCPVGTTEDLVHQGELELPVTRTAEFGPQMAGPQALRLHLLLKWGEDRPGRRVACVVQIAGRGEQQVKRLHLLADEPLHPVELLLELRLSTELPHRRLPLCRFKSILFSCVG